jgi:hypothetical protein
LNRRMQRTALMFSRVLTAGGMVIKISKCEASLLFCIGFVEKLFLHSSLLSRKFSWHKEKELVDLIYLCRSKFLILFAD